MPVDIDCVNGQVNAEDLIKVKEDLHVTEVFDGVLSSSTKEELGNFLNTS